MPRFAPAFLLACSPSHAQAATRKSRSVLELLGGFRFVIHLVGGWLFMVCTPGHAEPRVDFARQIQPLLAEKCLACHGSDKDEAGLRLHRRQAALQELTSGDFAIVPGTPQESTLLERVTHSDDDLRMPPEGDRLSEEQVALLTRWIKQGAEYEQHWSYRPLQVEAEKSWDELQPAGWVRNRIDQYVLLKLNQNSLLPSESASHAVLIKRLYYDLVGLPASMQEVDAFVHDSAPNAYGRLVDRLLASPHFGERWGRHWLDMARYADSDGYEKDRARPNAWRYRDWVLDAINRDLSFDQFTVEQIAGDLLSDATQEQQLATAFHRQTLTNTEGGTNPEQWRVAAVMDRTETVGAIWLGLTVGCARCHSHKYDELSHQEYYQLYAFFDNADEVNVDVAKTGNERRELSRDRIKRKRQVDALRSKVTQLEQQFPLNVMAWEKSLTAKQIAAFSIELREALSKAVAERDEKQRELIKSHYQKASQPLVDARAELKKIESQSVPADTVSIRALADRKKNPRQTHILRRGEFEQPMEAVDSASLGILPTIPAADNAAPNRLDFARWLASSDNPLGARVLVNHIWQYLFGQGIVPTPNDFGVRGDRPSHPELLDYLAQRFIDLGWSRKALVREIVMSATYRQASVHRPEMVDRDPQNRMLYRQNRFRVEAETLRDLTLSVGGLLDTALGGPSVFPPMPPEVAAISYANSFKWKTSSGGDRYRRGLYTFFKRTAPHPTLITFDCPDANVTNVRRNRSNTPLGALALMNNVVFAEAANGFARRVLEYAGDDRERMTHAMKVCVVRRPEVVEIDPLLELLAASRDHYRGHLEDARKLILLEASDMEWSDEEVVEQASWASTLRAVLNLDEFITRE